MFLLCSHALMDRIDPQALAAALLDSPPWMRIALAVRDPRLRQRAASSLAIVVAEHLARHPERPDERQLSLFNP
jgi:hypothetical protein